MRPTYKRFSQLVTTPDTMSGHTSDATRIASLAMAGQFGGWVAAVKFKAQLSDVLVKPFDREALRQKLIAVGLL